LIAIKTAVAKQLEAMRKDSRIGSSLDAEVELYCDEALLGVLNALGDELRFALITSYARAFPAQDAPAAAAATEVKGLSVLARASDHAKCSRCWHHREDVGSHAAHPDLCGRCVDNVDGDGEIRLFA
jgi:isoleucyl-tRNA synthetase